MTVKHGSISHNLGFEDLIRTIKHVLEEITVRERILMIDISGR